MIANYEEVYEPLLREILSKVGIMRKRQLLNCLLNCFLDLNRDQANSVLVALQRRGYAIYSEDGYAFTKGFLKAISGYKHLDSNGIKGESGKLITDKKGQPIRFNRNNYDHFLEYPLGDFLEGKITQRQRSMIDSMWIVSDMMPDSRDFVVAGYPWDFAFVSDGNDENPGRIFEVTSIPNDDGLLHLECMRALPEIDSRRIRESLRRIAILEDDQLLEDVPRIGFTHICVIDESEQSGYRVIERRKGIEAYEEWQNLDSFVRPEQ